MLKFYVDKKNKLYKCILYNIKIKFHDLLKLMIFYLLLKLLLISI